MDPGVFPGNGLMVVEIAGLLSVQLIQSVKRQARPKHIGSFCRPFAKRRKQKITSLTDRLKLLCIDHVAQLASETNPAREQRNCAGLTVPSNAAGVIHPVRILGVFHAARVSKRTHSCHRLVSRCPSLRRSDHTQ